MYHSVILKTAPDVKAIVLAAFPSYRKLKATVSEFHSGQNINSYWDGGSKDEYAIVELATLRRKTLPTSTHPYFDIARAGLANAEDAYVSVDHVGNVHLKALPDGYVLVSAGTFCGKPATAHIYANPVNLTRFLTA